MGRRGTKPVPTTLKVLKGGRKDRINALEPVPEPGIPDVPEHLEGAALGEWHRLVPMLSGMGVLTKADGAALASYCEAFGRWLLALEAIKEHGVLVETAGGNYRANPACGIAATCEAAMLRVLGTFGLTPSDRSRVKSGNAAGNKLDKFKIQA